MREVEDLRSKGQQSKHLEHGLKKEKVCSGRTPRIQDLREGIGLGDGMANMGHLKAHL